MNSKEKLYKVIQMYGFALDEVRIYLDTHPNCKKGLAYYHKYNKLKKEAVSEYIKIYGPLKSSQVESHDNWTWATECWPWERSCD